MVAELHHHDSTSLAGIGLDVVRAALDSERLKQSSENQALRRAARSWKGRAASLEQRLRTKERAMTELQAEVKGVELDRDHARAELWRKQSECSKLRGFKQRILASMDSGAVSTSMALLRAEVNGKCAAAGAESSLVCEPKGRARQSPNGTFVGGQQQRDRRRRSVSASDKVRNWNTDDGVCAEAQLLARKVALMREDGWAAADASRGASGSERSLLSTPLSPVKGSDAGGWDQLLDASAADTLGEAAALNASSAGEPSVAESGAATRHSTDASGSGGSSSSSSSSAGGARPWAGLAARRAEEHVDRWVAEEPAAAAAESPGVSSKVYSILVELERKADELQQQQAQQQDVQEAQEQRQRQQQQVRQQPPPVPTPVLPPQQQQDAGSSSRANQEEYQAAMHANAVLQKQLADAKQEIRQVRSANEHLVESVNAVRIELRGTPLAASMADASGAALATPAAAVLSQVDALRRAVELAAGSGGQTDAASHFEAVAARLEAQTESPRPSTQSEPPPMNGGVQSPPSPSPQPQERPPQPSPPPGSPPRVADRISDGESSSDSVPQYMMPRTTSRAPYVDENGVSVADGSSLSIAATAPSVRINADSSVSSTSSRDSQEVGRPEEEVPSPAFSDDRSTTSRSAVGWGHARDRLSETDHSMLKRAAQQQRRQRAASPASPASSSSSSD